MVHVRGSGPWTIVNFPTILINHLDMARRKNRALQVRRVVPYEALGNFPNVLYGTTRGTCSARFFRLVVQLSVMQL